MAIPGWKNIDQPPHINCMCFIVIFLDQGFAAPAPEPAPEPALEPALEPAEGVDTGEAQSVTSAAWCFY